ncbi:hypothetical protein ISF_08708 [Cordyceps fumosorosea ARSEF 2679]|uniref:Uncharacterized protein n=1 Tax=Cordyceps fumosorosea (strain ARSEF 2679) TaxID=1081104 RepID=A0A167LV39_CORFA|nr:hypothetical protein ISF_08708 [Cordyceps fumosorosea ARSEF 2679]OAA53547.1 hypothetical protein ISF_08708 [Cordyceps fumosorosea ARSEF 2679]
MRTAVFTIVLAGIATADLAPAPAPTAAALLEARAATACDVDYDLGRPVQPPASIKSWLRTARPPNECTDVMPASLTAGWMSYLGQLSSFVAHAGEKTASLTDLCGSATYTVSIEFCATQGKIVVTDEGSGDAVTTIANTVRNPGAVVLTSRNGKIGVASAAATESDSAPASTGSTGSSSGGATRTSTKGSAPATTGAATTTTTTGGATKSSAAASSTASSTPKSNAAGEIGAGVAAVAAGVALLAL